MKIRHAEINAHVTSNPAFEAMMTQMVELYATCPDASKIRFIQAIEDQFKSHAPARGRTAGGSSTGSGWRSEQKAQFSGRGAKWIKLTGPLMDMVKVQLGIFEKDGEDVSDYTSWINKEGYAWVRYSGPRGIEELRNWPLRFVLVVLRSIILSISLSSLSSSGTRRRISEASSVEHLSG